MPQARGSNATLGFQAETTFATDPGTPTLVKIYYVSESLRLSQALISSATITSARNPSQPIVGNKDAAGTINMELQAYSGSLLKAILGAVTTAAPTHTIKIGTSVPSLLIEKGFTDITTPQYFKYNGCKVNRATLQVRSSGYQNLALDFIGAKETVGTSPFDASQTDLGKSCFDGFKISTITEGGGAIATVLEADIVIENNLDGNAGYTINTTTPGARTSLPEGMVKVSGRLLTQFESIGLYTKATASTKSALQIIYRLGTGAGTAGNEQLTINVPELIYGVAAPVVTGPGAVVVDLPFEAFYGNDAGASAIWFELKNTETSI